jgi:hypothetical protein
MRVMLFLIAIALAFDVGDAVLTDRLAWLLGVLFVYALFLDLTKDV